MIKCIISIHIHGEHLLRLSQPTWHWFVLGPVGLLHTWTKAFLCRRWGFHHAATHKNGIKSCSCWLILILRQSRWEISGHTATNRAQRGNLLLVFPEQTSRHSGIVCSLFAVSLYPSLFSPVTTDYDEFFKLPVAVADGTLSLTEMVGIHRPGDKIFITNPRDQSRCNSFLLTPCEVQTRTRREPTTVYWIFISSRI